MGEQLASEMIGKVVLVGVTMLNRNDEALSQEQYFGTILRINEEDGLIICR